MCWNHAGHGEKSLVGALRDSCDVYFYEAGKRFYQRDEEELQKYVRSFGYGELTGIDLPGEAKGRVPDATWKKTWNEDYPEYQQWLPGDTVSLSIGQGDLLATPLQVAASHGAIANDGKLYKPHVLLSIHDGMDNVVRETKAELNSVQPIANKSSLSTVQRALREVITDGTGRSAFRNFGVAVAGKTGTAEMGRKDPITGKRDQDDYAWFVGYAPSSKPKYAVAIMIEQGGSGGGIAAPAARQIFAKLFDQKVELVNATDNSR